MLNHQPSMTITIPGDPIPQMRPRHRQMKGFIMTYDPQAKEKKSVKNYIMKFVNGFLLHENKQMSQAAKNMIEGENYEVSFSFFLPIPKTLSESKKNERLWDISPAACKPDLDNLEKFYLDCSNGILFKDDSLITTLSSKKKFSLNPRTEISIMIKESSQLHQATKAVLKNFNPSELESFISDIRKLAKIYPKAIDQIVFDDESYFKEVSDLIIDFADRYADILRKVRKDSQCKTALHQLTQGGVSC